MDKLHIADKRTSEWVRRYPASIAQADMLYNDRIDFGELWPDWCGLPMAATYAIITQGADVLTAVRIMRERPDDLPKLTAALLWRQAKAVYRADKTLVSELDAEDDMDMHVPIEVLKQLPYRCIYIEYPFALSPAVVTLGCFVWLEADRRAPSIVELRLMYLLANDNVVCVPLKLLGEKFVDSLSLIDSVGSLDRRAALAAVRQTVSLSLYICSDAADVETRSTTPARPHEPRSFAANPNAPTMWETGMRVGAAIRAYCKAPPDTTVGKGSHASPRPHVRRAHWHSFWTGPRDGDRALVLRWLPPIPINYSISAELPSVIRDIRAGKES